MTSKSLQLRLGVTACVFALFLVVFAIPQFVSAPSNVGKIILSPLFWPYTIAGLTCLIGLLLILGWWRTVEDGVVLEEPSENRPAAIARLFGLAVIMIALVWLLPVLGMVWTCMLAFVASAFLVQTRHPKIALICAVLVPLALYVFFAHVAGVAIPQGEFVRLP